MFVPFYLCSLLFWRFALKSLQLLDDVGGGLDEVVNIVIGENGSGKSEYLNRLAEFYLQEDRVVIAIATSIFDKFSVRHKRFNFWGGRLGRNIVAKVIKRSLLNSVRSEEYSYSHLVRALEYTGYDSVVRVVFKGCDLQRLVGVDDKLSSPELAGSINLIKKTMRYSKGGYYSGSGVLEIDLVGFYYGSVEGESLRDLLGSERALIKLGVLRSLELELARDGEAIPLSGASSGELMVLSGLVHISIFIKSGAVIIVDEPENSLHPRWQQNYIDNILDLFQYYEPKVIIATHSPLIIPVKTQGVGIYKVGRGVISKLDVTSSNNEDVLSEVFGVLTPESRYLSDQMVKILNRLEDGAVSSDAALSLVDEYRSKIHDSKQDKFLDGVVDLIKKVRKGLA